MNARQYLRDIIEMASEALGHAEAGGAREHAFWLFADEGALGGCAEMLADFVSEIDVELAGGK